MKIQLIELQDKFLLVSDGEIKEDSKFIDLDTFEVLTCHGTAGGKQLPKAPVSNGIAYPNPDFTRLVISENPDFSLLKEEDCKTIEWVNVEKLWLHFNRNHNNDTPMGKSQFLRAYEYVTAQSLNDKCFSLGDIEKTWKAGMEFIGEDKGDYDKLIQSLQQTSWDVEVNELNQITKIL